MQRLALAAKVMHENGISSIDTAEMFIGLKAGPACRCSAPPALAVSARQDQFGGMSKAVGFQLTFRRVFKRFGERFAAMSKCVAWLEA
eukprot:2125782-Amphidinium_carterae.1